MVLFHTEVWIHAVIFNELRALEQRPVFYPVLPLHVTASIPGRLKPLTLGCWQTPNTGLL